MKSLITTDENDVLTSQVEQIFKSTKIKSTVITLLGLILTNFFCLISIYLLILKRQLPMVIML